MFNKMRTFDLSNEFDVLRKSRKDVLDNKDAILVEEHNTDKDGRE